MRDHQQAPEQADLKAPGRRRFLKTGLGGALLLGTVGTTAALNGCSSSPAGRIHEPDPTTGAAYQFRFLTLNDIDLFRALLPAIVGPGLPAQPADRALAVDATIERIDAGICMFGPANQKELRQLFDLLNFGPTRITVARVWSSWPKVSTDEATAFLERWRSSSIGLFNSGYIALTKISNVSFYGAASQWHLSGYPGPPKWAADALPQFTNA